MDTDRDGGQTESCRSPAVQISAISAKLRSFPKLELGQGSAGQARDDGLVIGL